MQDGSCQDNDDKDLLVFKEVYLGIFYAFSMKGTKIKDKNGSISKEKAIELINKYSTGNLVAEWDDDCHYAKGFEYAQKFLRDKLPDNLIRLKLNSSFSLDFKP
jgi:hypothetical protein